MKDKLDLPSQVRHSLSSLICRLNTGKVGRDNPDPDQEEERNVQNYINAHIDAHIY